MRPDPVKKAACGSIAEVCKFLGIEEKKHLYRIRQSDPTFPKPVYLHGEGSRKPYFVFEEVEAWLRAQISRRAA